MCFQSRFSLFFVLCRQFEIERIVLRESDGVFYNFSRYNYTPYFNLHRRISFLSFSGINRTFTRKPVHILFLQSSITFESLRLQRNSKTLIYKDMLLLHDKKTFFIDLQKFKCYSSWSKLLFKIKRSDYFGINNDLSICFWKVYLERSFCRKELMILKIRDCTFNTSLSFFQITLFLSFIFFKCILMHIWKSPSMILFIYQKYSEHLSCKFSRRIIELFTRKVFPSSQKRTPFLTS